MGEEIPVGCARPVSSSTEEGPPAPVMDNEKEHKKEVISMIKVGGNAPDFTAPAYHKGKFINVKLSDYKGKWVVLCFYPGDFTFV